VARLHTLRSLERERGLSRDYLSREVRAGQLIAQRCGHALVVREDDFRAWFERYAQRVLAESGARP
jgi:hypothetical protein